MKKKVLNNVLKGSISLFVFFVTVFSLSAQTPWAEVVSRDTSICEQTESGLLKIKFTGKQPFGYKYKMVFYRNGSMVDGYILDRTEDKIFSNYVEETIKIASKYNADSVIVELTKVYDDTTVPWDDDHGMEVTGEKMVFFVDYKPKPSAGENIDLMCGYSATLDATPEKADNPYYWSDSPYGTFKDKTDPKTDFKAFTEGSYTLWFVEESGVCKDSASVDVELLGSPVAQISGSQFICSTDGLKDTIAVAIDLETDSLPYSFSVSDGISAEFSFSGIFSDTTVVIPATDNQTFKLKTLSDIRSGKECFATEDDMKGEAVVTDLKPAAYPGPGDTICGDMAVTLEAELEKAGNTGKWTATGVTFDDFTDPNAEASVTAHGIYTLTWTETEPLMGCKDSNEVVMNFAELPGLTFSNDTAICRGSKALLELNATGNSPWVLSYTFEETSNELNLNSPQETLELSPDVTSTVVLDSITGTYGCVTHINGKYKVTVDEMPHAFAGVYDPVCSNEIQLHAVPSIINSKGEWNGTGDFEDPSSPNTLFTAAGYGEQILSWTEVNTQNGNCKDISLVTIRFDKTPEDPFAGNDKKIYLEFSTALEADPANPGVGTWTASNPEIIIDDPNDPNTNVDNLKMGTQTFTWTVVNGVCDAKADSVVVEVKGLTSPNGFSPNGDGVNDFLKIMGAQHIQGNKLEVFDRNGKLVYSATDYQNDWNGTGMDGSPLDDGTYYYIFTGKNIDPVKEYLIIKRTKNNR